MSQLKTTSDVKDPDRAQVAVNCTVVEKATNKNTPKKYNVLSITDEDSHSQPLLLRSSLRNKTLFTFKLKGEDGIIFKTEPMTLTEFSSIYNVISHNNCSESIQYYFQKHYSKNKPLLF